MADLDDFFKKRDKKKKAVGAKAKFSTLDITDEFTRQVEATRSDDPGVELSEDQPGGLEHSSSGNQLSSAPVVAPQPTREREVPSGDGPVGDEEWKPFDSDENKDYSGLRINQNWKVEDEEENEEEAGDEEGERKVACPWAAGQAQRAAAAAAAAAIEEEERRAAAAAEAEKAAAEKAAAEAAAAAAPAGAAGGAYVPPHLRKAAGAAATTAAPAVSTAGGAYVPPHLRQKDASAASSGSGGGAFTSVTRKSNRAQPNINDTFEFPTLDAAVVAPPADATSGAKAPAAGEKSTAASVAATNGATADQKLEIPRKGARLESKTGGHMIDLENKFTALSTNN